MANEINVPNRTLFLGDNLDFLRGINSDSVDLIYLNPPRNTGKLHRGAPGSEARDAEYDDRWTNERWRTEWFHELKRHSFEVWWAVDTAAVTHDVAMSVYLTFMAVRLVELERIMKPTGSIYLQCDPRVSPYLRLIMDAIFGSENFMNEIVYRRQRDREGRRRWISEHDGLLFYTGPLRHSWNRRLMPHDDDYYERNFRYEDEGGRFRTSPLTKLGLRDDARGQPWRGIDPSAYGRHWSPPVGILEERFPDLEDISDHSPQQKMEMLDRIGLIHWGRRDAEPRYKTYTSMVDGQDISDFVTTVHGRLEPIQNERTGWPGQVPVALLGLILEVSTEQGDIVLDPFCGSGTACVAAELMERRWIGIEQDPVAEYVLSGRLLNEVYIDRGDVSWGDGVMEVTRDGEDLLPKVEEAPPDRTDPRRGEAPEDIADVLDAMTLRQGGGMLEFYGARCAECGRLTTLCSHCDAGVPSAEAAPSRDTSQESVRP